MGLLVLLILIWLFLPHPTGDVSPSAPEDRTREFPITETELPGPAGTLSGAAGLPPEDIAPNPFLEAYIEQELREGPYRIDLTYPRNEARLSRQSDGTHLFRLAGSLTVNQAQPAAEEDDALPVFRLHFFSNKPADYENFRPVFSEDISLQVEGNRYVFQLSHPEELDPGLYYFLIEGVEDREVFYVGKVSVVD